MSSEILTILCSTLFAAIAAPIGAWFNSRVQREKYNAELGKLRAEVEESILGVRKSELDNVRQASEILMNNIVEPLKIEIQTLRKDVKKFRKAIEKISTCPHSGRCPVSAELLLAEESSGEAGGENRGKARRSDKN